MLKTSKLVLKTNAEDAQRTDCFPTAVVLNLLIHGPVHWLFQGLVPKS
jgi:hypothetical protein